MVYRSRTNFLLQTVNNSCSGFNLQANDGSRRTGRFIKVFSATLKIPRGTVLLSKSSSQGIHCGRGKRRFPCVFYKSVSLFLYRESSRLFPTRRVVRYFSCSTRVYRDSFNSLIRQPTESGQFALAWIVGLTSWKISTFLEWNNRQINRKIIPRRTRCLRHRVDELSR